MVVDRMIKTARLEFNGFDDTIQKSGRIGIKDTKNPEKFDV